ncbi:hypothetical protein [Streptomyces catenulae]|uniref:DUF5709 domain-containing protein n=1 Tax=Streptomyces catenulae TaxID=66875 RepID=A0ABV2Z2E3_9ACTN|nr:hypothetical protein [Streptomyces catenulae]
MVADGQWAVGAQSDEWGDEDAVVEGRAADGRRAELTLDELARGVDPHSGQGHRDEDDAELD